METNRLRDFLNSVNPVPGALLQEYTSLWDHYLVPAKTIMTRPGEVERYMYFVEAGVQKSYYLKADKQHVIAFTYPPSLSGIPESFLPQKPSRYFLETIDSSQFLRISWETHQQMLAKHHPLETLFRKGVEMLLTGVLERHYELMAYSIEERFRHFLQRSPHLLNVVPHKDLASYLRIDSTNFSKLLNRVKI